jgi:hypothetical protein
MEHRFEEQMQRIERLLRIVDAKDSSKLLGTLTFYDVIIFACQSMWHLKDWILHDEEFGAADGEVLKRDIHAAHSLKVCADIANGSKHLLLKRPKVGTGAAISDREGLHFDSEAGIFQEFMYIQCPDKSDEFHGMEIRPFLHRCREDWRAIIDRHHLSNVYTWLADGQDADGTSPLNDQT